MKIQDTAINMFRPSRIVQRPKHQTSNIFADPSLCPSCQLGSLVRDVLKHIRHFRLSEFCPKEIIVHLAQFGIRKVIPPVHQPRLVESELGDKAHVLGSPYNSAGALTCCLPSLHRLHLNVSCVSHIVSVLKLNNWRRSSWVK
jgi:hypothetical protein